MSSTDMSLLQRLAQREFDKADITIGSEKPWDIQINKTRFYLRLLRGSVGLGTSYEDGDWDCNALDQFFYHFLTSPLARSPIRRAGQLKIDIVNALFNRQSVKRAKIVGKKHYDLGNDLYRAMLDRRMIYSCGYWAEAQNLDEAQEHKLRLICEKLQLKQAERVLDIGCGWGGFAKYAAEHYAVSVIGITISKEQAALAAEACKGLPVEIHLADYRDAARLFGTFDKVVSIGMFEHVGHKNYRAYMRAAAACLKDDGLFLLHSIGRSETTSAADPWIDTYIFPNGIVPGMKQIINAATPVFTIEDWHNFGPDYDKTLLAWHDNFERAWPELKSSYDERFHRRFRYYLLSCAAAFRARDIHLWQLVLTKKMLGGYRSIR
jgi:cyclopropane-fatty-acyl-phospholipid synthase